MDAFVARFSRLQDTLADKPAARRSGGLARGSAAPLRLREMNGTGWITALKNASIRTLVEQGQPERTLVHTAQLNRIGAT